MIFDARSWSRRWISVTDSSELREEDGLLERGVAAADDGDVLLAEEEAVAGRARRHAVAEEALLVRQAEHECLRAGRHDHRLAR